MKTIQNIVILTGAGVSAESGIDTFRDAGGLWEQHRVEDVATPEAFALIDEALRAYPRSAKLWCFRGALIQLGPADSGYTLDDALKSYEKATEVEPECPDGWEELGHYHDVHLDDEVAAKRFWHKAEILKNKNA